MSIFSKDEYHAFLKRQANGWKKLSDIDGIEENKEAKIVKDTKPIINDLRSELEALKFGSNHEDGDDSDDWETNFCS